MSILYFVSQQVRKDMLVMQIVRHQMLDLQNMVYCETNIDSSDARTIAKKVHELEQAFGVRKEKKILFVLKRNNESAVIEAILFPIDSPDSIKDSRYKLKRKMHIESAVKIRHEGDWNMLENTIECLNYFIAKQELKKITTYYCSVLTGLNRDELRDVIVDIYVGVSRNIL